MSDHTHDDCAGARRSYMEAFLSDKGVAGTADHAALHVRDCGACSAWLARAIATVPAPPPRSLYTPALRRRTLAAVDTAAEDRVGVLLWWLIPAALGSFFLWAVAPTWAVSRLVGTVLGPGALSFGIAFVIVSSIGTAVSGFTYYLVCRTGRCKFAFAGPAGSFREES